jgi:hypothetical protein
LKPDVQVNYPSVNLDSQKVELAQSPKQIVEEETQNSSISSNDETDNNLDMRKDYAKFFKLLGE